MQLSRLLQYQRDRGLFVPAYFVSKDAMCLLDIVVRASLYSGLVYSFLVPQCGIITLWLISCYVCYYASGVGFVLAVLLSPNAALIAGVILPTTLGAMLSGMIDSVPNWLTYISFIRYATEWFVVSEVVAIDHATGFDPDSSISLTSIALFANTKGYTRVGSDSTVQRGPAWALFLFGLAFRIIAVIGMHLVNNDRVSYLMRRVACATCRAKNVEATQSAGTGPVDTGGFDEAAVAASRAGRAASNSAGAEPTSPRSSAPSTGAMMLLNSDALQRFTNRAATSTKTLRFQLPQNAFPGQQIHVQDPESGETVGVMVPMGAVPGNFLTIRYTTAVPTTPTAPTGQSFAPQSFAPQSFAPAPAAAPPTAG